jgi:hypothetical protein
MFRDMTRSHAIQGWFAAVAVVLLASIAFGPAVTVGTGALLVALSLVPPAMTLMLWPGPQPATVAEVLYGADRRG